MANIEELLNEVMDLAKKSKGGLIPGGTIAKAIEIQTTNMRKKKGDAAAKAFLDDLIDGYKTGRYPVQYEK